MDDFKDLPLMRDALPHVHQAFKQWQDKRRRGRPLKADKQIAISAKLDPDILSEIDRRGLVRNRFINDTLRAALALPTDTTS
jgi:uncharacterized protein (DUF4415 family)